MILLRIWSCRIFSFLPIYLFGTFTVCIPWKISQLEMAETAFSYVILTFGLAMITAIQFCRIILMPRFGTLHLMPIGGLLFSINFYFWTSANEYLTFLLLAFPAGMFFGLVSPPANVETFRLEGETGKILFPIFEAFMSLGILMGALTSGFLLAQSVQPEAIFSSVSLIVGIICIFLIIVTSLKFTIMPTAKTKLKFPDKVVILPGIIAALVYATYGIIVDWSAHWLSTEYKVSAFIAGIIIYFFSGTELLALFLGSKLLRNYGEKMIAFYGMLFGCFALLACLIFGNVFLIGLAFGIFGFFTANFHPILMRITGRLEVVNKEDAISDVNLMSFSGFIIGPPIIGFIGEHYGLTWCMFALPMLWIICAVLIRPKLTG